MSDKQLSIPTEINWPDLIDELAEQVDLGQIPEKALKTLPYLMMGLPRTEVARLCGVSRRTINQWLKENPALQIAVERGKDMAQDWRLKMLEAQFVMALEVSEKILKTSVEDEDPEEGDIGRPTINAKLLTAQGQHARFIIDKFVSSKREVTLTHELGSSVLDARQDALDYLAHSMQTLDDDDVVGVYRIIDNNVHHQGPMLDEDGNPNFGTIGGITYDEELGAQCHDCGQFFRSLAKHIIRTMNISVADYETMYALEPGTVTRISP